MTGYQTKNLSSISLTNNGKILCLDPDCPFFEVSPEGMWYVTSPHFFCFVITLTKVIQLYSSFWTYLCQPIISHNPGFHQGTLFRNTYIYFKMPVSTRPFSCHSAPIFNHNTIYICLYITIPSPFFLKSNPKQQSFKFTPAVYADSNLHLKLLSFLKFSLLCKN